MARTMDSPWQLLKKALRDYRQHWVLLVGIVVVVGAPVALVSVFGIVDTSSDTTAAAYVGFAQVAMNAAVIYAITRIVAGTAVLPTIRAAYYNGSGAFIRLFLVSVILVLMLVFLLLGLFIVAAGVLAPGAQLALVEQLLLIGLAIAVALPSLWLLPRSLWAIYLIYETQLGPIQAVRSSWNVTTGRTRATLGYVAALGVFLLGLLALPVAAIVVLQMLTQWPVWEPVLQLTATLIVVPISNLYLYRYLRNIRD